MVQAKTFKDSNGRYYSPSECILKDGKITSEIGEPLRVSFEKMSKSKGNGVEPMVYKSILIY